MTTKENPHYFVYLGNRLTGDTKHIKIFYDKDELSSHRLRRKALYNHNKFDLFWGLTLAPEYVDENGNIIIDGKYTTAGELMRKFFNKFRIYLKRKFSDRKFQKLSYIWKLEYGSKTGRPHFHLFTNGVYFKNATRTYKSRFKRWVSQTCWKYGFIDVKYIKEEQAQDNKRKISSYLAKYLSKDTSLINGSRRWSSSRDIIPPEKEYQMIAKVQNEEQLQVCMDATIVVDEIEEVEDKQSLKDYLAWIHMARYHWYATGETLQYDQSKRIFTCTDIFGFKLNYDKIHNAGIRIIADNYMIDPALLQFPKWENFIIVNSDTISDFTTEKYKFVNLGPTYVYEIVKT